MNFADLPPILSLATLLIVLLVAVAGLVMFKRKRSNQHPMEQRRDGAIAKVRTPDSQ